MKSNLECFLDCTTPTVPSQHLPKTSIWDIGVGLDWQIFDDKKMCRSKCFNLGELWKFYDEWSAYGVGSPISISGGKTVVQYYTPYLSAIQIYTTRNTRSSCDGGESYELKSWSSESMTSAGSGSKLSRSSSSSSSDKIWDMEELGIGIDQDHSLERDRDRLRGDLYFEHFEVDGPFGRPPLKDKVDVLSLKNPGLKGFNSIDLSRASWMAIAWYPIYHIPHRWNSKQLYASFLTYHKLSSPFQDDTADDDVGNDSMSIPPFGLATYRMQPKIWLNPDEPSSSDRKKIYQLMNGADSWLKQNRIQHHDYKFFISRPMSM